MTTRLDKIKSRIIAMKRAFDWHEAYPAYEMSEDLAWAVARIERLEGALEYVVSREDYTFAECSEAETIIRIAREALAASAEPSEDTKGKE